MSGGGGGPFQLPSRPSSTGDWGRDAEESYLLLTLNPQGHENLILILSVCVCLSVFPLKLGQHENFFFPR